MSLERPEAIDPKYFKLTYQRAEGPVSRRDLLFRSLRPQYEVVPAVEGDACTAWKGCTQCLTACPQQAIALDGSAATIEKAKCVGCGACLPICPVGAIRQPLLNPERLEAELKALLLGGEAGREPRVLCLVADGGSPPEPLNGLPSLRLPSVGVISPWLLVRAFALGADGIAMLPCRSGCRHRCDLSRWQQTLSFTRELLTRFGIEAERLVAIAREDAPLKLKAFCEAMAGLGSHRLSKRGGWKAKEALTLAALLKDLVALAPDPSASIVGTDVPFGVVSVQVSRCTLCGACPERCATGALAFREDDESSQLLFDHARCVACEACVKVCPEGAVEMEQRLEFSQLGKPEILAEDRMVRCERCGATIAPQSMLSKVRRSLNGTKVSGGKDLGRYCPPCLMLQSLAGARR